MFKRLSLILVLLLLIPSVFSIEDSLYLNEKLNGRGFSDMIDSFSQIYDNDTQKLTIIEIPGHTEYSSYDLWLTNDVIVGENNYGVWSGGSKILYLNIEKFQRDSQSGNYTDNESRGDIANTVIHELTHRMMDGWFDIVTVPFLPSMPFLNVSTTITNTSMDYYRNLTNYYVTPNSSDIPQYLKSSVDFNWLYNESTTPYPSSQWAEETIVRIVALCYNEKDSYTYYWEMFEHSNYSICDEFNFTEELDVILTNEVTLMIEGWGFHILGFSSLSPSFAPVEDIVEDSFTVLDTTVGQSTNIILLLTPISIIIFIISLFGVMFYPIIQNVSKFLKK